VNLEIPRLRDLASHAGPHLIEATFVPLAIFYCSLWAMGVWGALGTALAWSYGVLGLRLLRRERVPGILLLGVAGLTIRTIISVASGSVFIYFLQPTLGTVVVAGTFLFSAALRRPLAERLAGDFCPLPLEFIRQPAVRRFFTQISLLWGLVYVANAGVTLWVLITQPLSTYLWAKTLISIGLTGTGVIVSVMWFQRTMRRHGVTVTRHRAPGVEAGVEQGVEPGLALAAA
jgi:hypothetical protein